MGDNTSDIKTSAMVPLSKVRAEEDPASGGVYYDPFSTYRENTLSDDPPQNPSIHDIEVLERICALLVEGYGLSKILSMPGFPHRSTVYREIARNPNGLVATSIARAREEQHHAIMDRCTELAESITEENYNSIKAKIAWYQWHQARVHPRKYGETKQLEVTTNDKPVQLDRNEFEDIAYRIVDEV